MPKYILAARLLREVGLLPDEQRQMDANLGEHVVVLTWRGTITLRGRDPERWTGLEPATCTLARCRSTN